MFKLFLLLPAFLLEDVSRTLSFLVFDSFAFHYASSIPVGRGASVPAQLFPRHPGAGRPRYSGRIAVSLK